MPISTALRTPSCLLPGDAYRRERWRNGLGWTREILRLPLQGDDWALRLSIAEIECDAAFSTFEGVERELVLLQGEGVRLRFDDGRVQQVLPPHGRVRFAGEAAVQGELVDGITHDFNLMWRRDVLDAQLLHRPLSGAMHFFSEADVGWAAHLLSGHAQCVAGDLRAVLQPGDSAWFAAGTRKRFTLEGGGELLAIRVACLG